MNLSSNTRAALILDQKVNAARICPTKIEGKTLVVIRNVKNGAYRIYFTSGDFTADDINKEMSFYNATTLYGAELGDFRITGIRVGDSLIGYVPDVKLTVWLAK